MVCMGHIQKSWGDENSHLMTKTCPRGNLGFRKRGPTEQRAAVCFGVFHHDGLQSNGNGLQPTSHGLQPNSDGLQPNSDGLRMASNLAMASE